MSSNHDKNTAITVLLRRSMQHAENNEPTTARNTDQQIIMQGAIFSEYSRKLMTDVHYFP